MLQKAKLKSKNPTGRIFNYNDILLLENHHTGFGEKVLNHILETNHKTYTLSAHPLMLDFQNKKENKNNLLFLLKGIQNSKQDIEFVRPLDILQNA